MADTDPDVDQQNKKKKKKKKEQPLPYVPPEQRFALNLPECSAHYGLPVSVFRRAIRRGQLAYLKPGRAYVIRPCDLKAWVESELRRGGVKLTAKAAR